MPAICLKAPHEVLIDVYVFQTTATEKASGKKNKKNRNKKNSSEKIPTSQAVPIHESAPSEASARVVQSVPTSKEAVPSIPVSPT